MATATQLTWINLSEPSKYQTDKELRVRVRSHVTTLQHTKRKGLRSSARRRQLVVPLVSSKNKGNLSESEEVLNIFHDWEDVDGSESVPLIVINVSSYYPTPRPLQDPSDELGVHIYQLGANVSEVIKYYDRLIVHQGPGFRSASSLAPPSEKNKYLPYLLTDPALLAATCLLILAGMRSHRPHTWQATEAYIVALRLYTINTVQKAVDAHAISDQVILAVGLLIVYETIFGRPERYHVHSQGLRDMVLFRGGLRNLGFGGLIEALVLWYDANAAGIHGCVPYLEGMERTKKEPPRVDQEHFLCWVPDKKVQREKVVLEEVVGEETDDF